MSKNEGNPIQGIKDEAAKLTSSAPSLKQVVKTSVQQVNSLLATLENQKNDVDRTVNSFASSRLVPLMRQTRIYAQRAMGYYQRREYYGPQIIAGSVATVGSFVYLRRGKLPAAFTSTVTGIGAYAGIYGGPNFNQK